MSESLEKMSSKRSAKPTIILLFFLLFIVAAAIGFFKFYEHEKPQINFQNDISTFGLNKDVNFTVTDSRSGISLVEILLSQNSKSSKLYEKKFSRQGFFGHNGPERLVETVTLKTGSLGFKDGAAELKVTVRDFSFWN